MATTIARFFVCGVIGTVLLIGCKSLQSAPEGSLEEQQEVIDHSLSKSEAFTQARRWVAQNYVDANKVIQVEDEDEGTLIVNAAADLNQTAVPGERGSFDYVLTLDFKDNKMRITFEPVGWREEMVVTKKDVENIDGYYQSELKQPLVASLEEEDF